MSEYLGPLHKMAMTTPTEYWNDSCSIKELQYALERGAVGATTNPVIVKNVLKNELPLYQERIKELIAEMPSATEDDIAWVMIEEMAVAGAKILQPIFEKTNGQQGRISIQTNTKYFRNPELLVEQAIKFNQLAPNMQVKMPTTSAGIKAFEEATFYGVSINATVSFSVPQAIAVAEAVERGLKRREAAGHDTSKMHPVCTIMVGRLDDWLKNVVVRDGLIVNPECLEWAGVAAVKRAYEIFKERGYRTKLLSAAYRNHYHWSEFIGGDMIETIPYEWQVKFNNSTVAVENRIDKPVDPIHIKQLQTIPDFVKAYEPNGMKVEEFDSYGAVNKTLLQFNQGYDELINIIRSFMIIPK